MLELDKYLARDKLSQEKGDWGLTYAEKWRGKTYALAYWVEPFGIYYNKTMFQKLASPTPGRSGTSRGSGRWRRCWTPRGGQPPRRRTSGAWTGPPATTRSGTLIWTQGVTHFDYDLMKWQLDIPASVQAHTWMMDWVKKTRWNISGNPERGEMMAPWGGRALDNSWDDTFRQRQGGHPLPLGERLEPDVAGGQGPVRLGHDAQPSINGKTGASWTAGHPVNAWAKTKHPDDVWEFLKFLIMDDFQNFMGQEQILVPSKLSAQAQVLPAPGAVPQSAPQVFSDVFKRPHGIYMRHFEAGKNGTVYNEFRDKIFSGELGMGNGLKEASARMTQDIDFGGGEPPFKGLKMPIQPK